MRRWFRFYRFYETLFFACVLGACNGHSSVEKTSVEKEQLSAAARERLSAEEAEKARKSLDKTYPNHAAVTGVEVRVYAAPSAEATVVGWLRVGARVRLAALKTKNRGCKKGWYPIHPTGFVCASDGIYVSSTPIDIEYPSDEGWKNDQEKKARSRGALVLPPAAKDAPLPYDYYFVKIPTTPDYHRLPSRNEQRAALAKSEHFQKLLEKDEERAWRYLDGESQVGPSGTEVTARYLEHGFYVASNGSEVRASRRFVRTNKGSYIKQTRLEKRQGYDFKGVDITKQRSLPVAWTVRTTRPLKVRESEDGRIRFNEDATLAPIERQTLLTGWKGLRRMQGRVMHQIETASGMRYLRSWFVAVAFPIKRNKEVPPGSPWIHVDTRQQTAVLYQNDNPVFATLVSTGLEGHETPIGVFEIRRKRVTDTMADLGPEAGDDRYRIEDIPWVQYFEGSFALHCAFWHTHFGIKRSHGCVNLSPLDAYRLFKETLPAVPEGWHGLSTEGTRFRGSFVVITDEDLSTVADQNISDKDRDGEESDTNRSAEQTVAGDPDEEGSTQEGTQGIRVPKNWIEPWRRRQPERVTYAVKRGGTARFVANLFGLFHHEMEQLNPEIKMDAQLDPGTELLVYQADRKQPSLSIGYPSNGSLKGAVPLPDGAGRILKANPRKLWATRRTIGILDAVLRAWPRIEPQAKPLLVGNLSMRKGGKLEPHHTHQSGRDVDFGYPQIPKPGEAYNWREMNKRNLDLRRTWRLLHLLQATGEIEVILIDRSLQKLLYDYALTKELMTRDELAGWLQYPHGIGDTAPLVQHAADHTDHIHVRFRCGGQAGCKSRRQGEAGNFKTVRGGKTLRASVR